MKTLLQTTAVPVRKPGGFTLIELIAAFAAISVAASILFGLFAASAGLGRTARDQAVAGTLAEEQLTAIQRQPERYQWHLPDAPAPDKRYAVTKDVVPPPEGYAFDPPGLLPADPQAARRDTTLYANFHWKAFARPLTADAAYYELTVLVTWETSGRPQSLALTSAVSRKQADAHRASPAEAIL